jgi:hypothetical protein
MLLWIAIQMGVAAFVVRSAGILARPAVTSRMHWLRRLGFVRFFVSRFAGVLFRGCGHKSKILHVSSMRLKMPKHEGLGLFFVDPDETAPLHFIGVSHRAIARIAD